MNKTKLTELRGKLKERGEQLHKILEEAGPGHDMDKVQSIDGDSTAKVEKIRALNDELDALAKDAEPLEAEYAEVERASERAEKYGRETGHPLPEKGEKNESEPKSIGELFFEHEVAGEMRGRTVEIDMNPMATLFKTTEGWEPESTRTGRIVDIETRPIQVTDLIPAGATSQQVVKFMEETTLTNEAKELKEGEKYVESALKLAEAESPVRKIGTWLPVTDEQLEDVPQAQGYINRRLPFLVKQRLDSQILKGTGVAPNLTGFLEFAGVLAQAKGTDPTPDAIFKAATKVRVEGRAVPGPVILHPNDWQDIRLLRTNDGIYIWGNPADAGPERIFGHTVVVADAITEGTGLIGDFAGYSELPVRRGLEMKVTDTHAEHFIEGKQAVRADIRAALVIYRPKAFAKITGI